MQVLVGLENIFVSTVSSAREKLLSEWKFPMLPGRTIRITTGCGPLFITINFKEEKPYEIFARLGKAGGCASAQTEAVARLASGWLRGGLDIHKLVLQLVGIRCHLPVGFGAQKTLSCADAIGKALREVYDESTVDLEHSNVGPAIPPGSGNDRPGDCGAGMEKIQRTTCPECG